MHVVLRGASSLFRRIVPSIFAAVFPRQRTQIHNMNERTDPPHADEPIVKCDICGDQMKCLAKLPETRIKRAVRVFRCYGCNNVTSEPW